MAGLPVDKSSNKKGLANITKSCCQYENKDLHVFLIKLSQLWTFLERGTFFHISCGLHVAPITSYYFIHICLMSCRSTLPHNNPISAISWGLLTLIWSFPFHLQTENESFLLCSAIYHFLNIVRSTSVGKCWAVMLRWVACWPWHADKHTLSVWPHGCITPLVLPL